MKSVHALINLCKIKSINWLIWQANMLAKFLLASCQHYRIYNTCLNKLMIVIDNLVKP